MLHTQQAGLAGLDPRNTRTPAPNPKTQRHTLPSRAAPDGILQHRGGVFPCRSGRMATVTSVWCAQLSTGSSWHLHAVQKDITPHPFRTHSHMVPSGTSLAECMAGWLPVTAPLYKGSSKVWWLMQMLAQHPAREELLDTASAQKGLQA